MNKYSSAFYFLPPGLRFEGYFNQAGIWNNTYFCLQFIFRVFLIVYSHTVRIAEKNKGSLDMITPNSEIGILSHSYRCYGKPKHIFPEYSQYTPIKMLEVYNIKSLRMHLNKLSFHNTGDFLRTPIFDPLNFFFFNKFCYMP